MKLKILCCVSFSPYWGGDLPPNVLDLEEGKSLGGGEENALRVAAGLRALGHEVELHWYGGEGVWRGVRFYSLNRGGLYQRLAEEKWDVVAEWSGLRALERAPKGARRIFVQQLNDLLNFGDWSVVDCIVSPSENHAQQLPTWGWRNKPYAVVHNGLDIELYQQRVDGDASNELHHLTPWADRPLNVGYWSSPDRGLHHVLRAWPLIREQVSGAKLHVFYEIDRYLSFATRTSGPYGDRARILEKLVYEAKLDPSITFHGHVPRKKLAKTQISCRVMFYPYDVVYYCEGFAGAVNQGVASGALVMATPKDALPSLYGDAVYWMREHRGESDYHEYLANMCAYALRGLLTVPQFPISQFDTLAEAKKLSTRYTWDAASKEMERACLGEGWKLTKES